MAVREKRQIEGALERKGFTCRVTDHKYYYYYSLAGKKTLVKTKVSLGGKPKTIGGDLLSFMARQCKLTTPEFLELVDCTMDQKIYERVLFDRGLSLE
ncbi:hypothetical protein [Pelodictyon luteolum]|uniref:Type II toxin-antitoxin system HicA family toxin n=1 Tax=Chlorobium luteolum (strain DSM 273 / BCRC 81028 / 2530) TaxID=319225 RepID=Q3B1R4_CHLL3|nr:hypothetical protein [Pelodictyon luteolum]ABB24717.1 hypothetical protein Plut_1869 [Pelodictyon luteolum DSM 273]